MTDHTQSPIAPFRPKPVAIAPELLKRRRRYDFVFYLMGRLSVVISVGLLLALFGSIFYWAMPAFITAEVALKIPTRALLQQSQNISNQNKIIEQCLKETYPHLDGEKQLKSIGRLYSLLAVKEIKQHLKKRSKEDIKTPSKDDILWVRVTAEAASFLKNIERGRDTQNSRLTQVQKDFLKELSTSDHLRWRFNWVFFTGSDSQEAELAGIWGGFLGSLFVLGVALLFALPVGVMTAIYLEEFVRDSRLSRIIEINLNNLAAVPSVVYGLLGLAVFLNFMHLPRSSALVGGLTLGLMLLPILIVATRTALRAVPNSIRDAARGIGASTSQVVFHHVIPLATPGILTGGLIAIARAMGESASLLMIGLMAFITLPPKDIFGPTTVLPVQIYQWVERPERGFDELSSAAILVLLIFLGGINWGALFLKKKFEKKW